MSESGVWHCLESRFGAATFGDRSARSEEMPDPCGSRCKLTFMPHLFSYGTLQQDDVQRSTFGRLLSGHADVLPGYSQDLVAIDDPDVVATSGKTHHPILKHSGAPEDRVAGTVFEISDGELAQADRYEVAAYRRVAVTLDSGLSAWVYVDARFAPPA